jgi:hypothetical protein
MPMNRREFLTRTGIAGLAALLPLPGCEPTQLDPVPNLGVDTIGDLLLAYTVDTFHGIASMVVPGDDIYSRLQGVATPGEGGGVEADAAHFAIEVFDDSPLVDLEALGPVASRLLDIPIPPPGVFPVSLGVALIFNFEATALRPLSILPGLNGVLSPFSRLSLDDKVKCLQLVETLDAPLLALIDEHLPEPFTASASGLLKYVGGVIVPVFGFAAYSEYAVFDRKTRILKSRPVGWTISNYQPDGAVEGWDDFKGYFEGRREVTS